MSNAVRQRPSTVKFLALAWDQEQTAANAPTMDLIEAYVAKALALGLSDDEMSDDLNARFGEHAPITVTTMHTAVWVQVGETDPEA